MNVFVDAIAAELRNLSVKKIINLKFVDEFGNQTGIWDHLKDADIIKKNNQFTKHKNFLSSWTNETNEEHYKRRLAQLLHAYFHIGQYNFDVEKEAAKQEINHYIKERGTPASSSSQIVYDDWDFTKYMEFIKKIYPMSRPGLIIFPKKKTAATPTATSATTSATSATTSATSATPTATSKTPTATSKTPTATSVTPTATSVTPTENLGGSRRRRIRTCKKKNKKQRRTRTRSRTRSFFF